VDARFVDFLDDVPIEVGADKTHPVAIVGQRRAKAGSHKAGA
jgi:hypothetical protein